MTLQRAVLTGPEGTRAPGRTSDDNLTLLGRGIMEYLGVIIEIADSEYTLQARDAGAVLVFTGADAHDLNLPDTLPAGFSLLLFQAGAGAVTLSVVGNSTIQHRQSHVGLAGQYAFGSLFVWSNTDGTSATYGFGGDTA
jgi:hypothetical protein